MISLKTESKQKMWKPKTHYNSTKYRNQVTKTQPLRNSDNKVV